MRKILKFVLWILFSIVFFILLVTFTVTTVENIEIDIQIQKFIAKGIYQEDISTSKIKYYKIDSNEKSSMTTIVGYKEPIPGAPGDILVSREQNTMGPFLNEFITYTVGGHAGYITGVYKDYKTKIPSTYVEESTMKNNKETPITTYPVTDWMTNKYFNSVIGLRVSMTEIEYEKVTATITSMLGDPYNASFLFDTTNKSYCSDLISKGFYSIGKDLNRDKFATTIFDLILSPDTYISYYHYFDGEGIKYIYYF